MSAIPNIRSNFLKIKIKKKKLQQIRINLFTKIEVSQIYQKSVNHENNLGNSTRILKHESMQNKIDSSHISVLQAKLCTTQTVLSC